MRVRTLHTVSRDGTRHPAGTELDLPTATAEHLLALKPPAVARLEPIAHSATGPAVFDASASVKVLVPQIRASADAVLLAVLRQAELNRPDGPRATVVSAIDERLDAIAASDDEDDTDEDDGE